MKSTTHTTDRRKFLKELFVLRSFFGFWTMVSSVSATCRRPARHGQSSVPIDIGPTSIAACSARFWNISGAPFTQAYTNRDRNSQTRKVFVKMWQPKSKLWACRSCDTPAGILSQDTTGLTGLVRKTKGQRSSSEPGILSRQINLGQTNSLSGAGW